ncbi:MAG: MotA/TolQ/ExbB proton channel family protein [Bdellovibrionaceae bacterium]|nr:MotA/TolQ/ExbB proton channel family protein [Pseudobdellovibrionaceae bacterium]
MEMFSKIAIAFEEGGFWMWPILATQLVSLAILAERTYALYFKNKINQSEFVNGFEEAIRRGELDNVLERAKSSMAEMPVAKAIIAGAKAAKNFGGKEEIQGKMDEVLLYENSLVERRIGFLTMLGNVATLTGLLGTITGMIKSFAAVANAVPAEKAALLAAGIAEAMNATAYGLITAIPALVMYAVLQNRANHLVEDLNRSALKVFNWLSYSYEPVGFKSFRTGREGKETVKEINA